MEDTAATAVAMEEEEGTEEDTGEAEVDSGEAGAEGLEGALLLTLVTGQLSEPSQSTAECSCRSICRDCAGLRLLLLFSGVLCVLCFVCAPPSPLLTPGTVPHAATSAGPVAPSATAATLRTRIRRQPPPPPRAGEAEGDSQIGGEEGMEAVAAETAMEEEAIDTAAAVAIATIREVAAAAATTAAHLVHRLRATTIVIAVRLTAVAIASVTARETTGEELDIRAHTLAATTLSATRAQPSFLVAFASRSRILFPRFLSLNTANSASNSSSTLDPVRPIGRRPDKNINESVVSAFRTQACG